ncbi:MAG TPA: ankyrin repeat domain-containing protein [Candidatus Nanopelagicales bacterium]
MAELTDEELEFAHQVFDLAREGATEELAGYVDAGVPVNLTNSSGDSLLMLAAYYVHPDTVAALLARGADHSRVNARGQTALAAAVFRDDAEIVTLLLDAGADPHAGPRTAVEVAQFFDLPQMAALLAARPGPS